MSFKKCMYQIENYQYWQLQHNYSLFSFKACDTSNGFVLELVDHEARVPESVIGEPLGEGEWVAMVTMVTTLSTLFMV